MNIIKKKLTISGHVQGVGFRYFTSTEAKQRNLNGWVKNKDDGTVEVLLSGEKNHVQEMIARLHEGPASAVVNNVREVPVKNNNQPDGFNILRS
ncbi:MAG: acylphosphatase [Balneolaceae bacterium]